MPTQVTLQLRFPDAKLHAALVKEAKAAHRSLNAHLLYLLETHGERKKARK